MVICSGSIYITTVSGGIVNFGGAISISPVSITKSTEGSGESNAGTNVMENPVVPLTRLVMEGLGSSLTGQTGQTVSRKSNPIQPGSQVSPDAS